MKHSITIEIDTDSLRNVGDSYLAACWNIAQLNPAPRSDMDAGRLVGALQGEIVRRWLAQAGALQYERTADGYCWDILRQHGSWPGPDHKTWVYEPGKAERAGDQARDEAAEATLVDAEVRRG